MVDGFGTFTQANQAYYQCDVLLHTAQTSGTRLWRLHVPPTVASFQFFVYVDARVQYPNGWMDVSPPGANVAAGNSVARASVVRDAIGRTQTGQTVTYATTNAAIASVNPTSGVVAGVADGFATIPATSGTRSGAAIVMIGSVPPVACKLSGINLGLHADGSALGSPVPEATVLMQMLRLTPYVSALRSYSMHSGEEYIVFHGHRLGFQVACSAFLNGGQNDLTESASLIAAVDRGLCDLAVVGTETFLSNADHPTPLSEAYLLGLIQLVKPHSSAAGIPVTTAQTYSEYLAHLPLFAAVDVVFAKFFPYWQGAPAAVAIAPLHEGFQRVRAIAESLGKTVIVSEAGHPSSGNTVVKPEWGPPGAIPSPSNAADYFQSFASWARALNVPYFYFAAYDEPAKATAQNPQEGHFGVWDASFVMKTGMQQVFDGVTLPLVGGAGQPSIQFTHVPVKGSTSDLVVTGLAQHVTPADYAAAVYIKVNGFWVNKPFGDAPAVAVLRDGSWRCVYVTGGNDQDATDIVAYLIPVQTRPPVLMYGTTTTLPPSLNAYPSFAVVR